MNITFSYIPGTLPHNPGPLARFLPPLLAGSASAWLADHVEPGTWLLDPFGTSPQLAVEAARYGCRVLVAANNPVTRFLLQMQAEPPSSSDLKAALAELSVSHKGEDRLETHIQSLYIVACASCQRQVPAQAFLWHKGAKSPYAYIYKCKVCGEGGERLANPADIERAVHAAATDHLHRARVLERIAPLDDPDREYAEEALSHYLPRALYALSTLINRLDNLGLSPARQRGLIGILLSACDSGNSLWPHPTERPRPKQLSTPAHFRENNLWLALEENLSHWETNGQNVPVTTWPQVPEGAGLCLFEGRLKDLAIQAKNLPFRAVLTALPRPNQAFWTLSALWAGWLWGREAAAPFKNVLRRRRYDWDWHAEALQAACGHLFDLLVPGTLFFALLTEAEPPFLNAAMTAADLSGFDLEALAMRTAHDPVQIVWKRRVEARGSGSLSDPEPAGAAIRSHLSQRGEAATYLHLYTSSITALAENRILTRPDQPIHVSLAETNNLIQQTLRSDDHLIHYDAGAHGLEAGLWGLTPDHKEAEPLFDRVEMEVVRFLARNPGCSLIDIEQKLYPQFPSLLTPSVALVQAVLDSYGTQRNLRWYLRDEDQPSIRQADLEDIARFIEDIGKRLTYNVHLPESTIRLWQEADTLAYAFFLSGSALVGHIFTHNPYPAGQSLLVLPGGRASLLAYKLRRDPVLRQRGVGWRFVKFRLIRALAEIPVMNRQTWEEQINSDPIEQVTGQMMMF